MNKLIESPCLNCEKKGCGAYHGECPAFIDYQKKIESYKHNKWIAQTLQENKVNFWKNVRKKGLHL